MTFWRRLVRRINWFWSAWTHQRSDEQIIEQEADVNHDAELDSYVGDQWEALTNEERLDSYFGEQRPSLSTLASEWDALTDDERSALWDDFQWDCIDGSKEPSDYWYPLLMPRCLAGYVGD